MNGRDLGLKNKDLKPLIISLLVLNKDMVKNIGSVTSSDIYEQNSTIFKNDGLFSTMIFGESGSEERFTNFGYIDLILDIIHPAIYKSICTLGSIYKGILDGTKYVIFDEDEGDFTETDIENGYTGYSYFLKHFKSIKFKNPDDLISRGNLIDFVTSYSVNEIKFNKNLILPAGLRDYTVTENGKIMEDEINGFYRKLLNVSNTAKVFKQDNESTDPIINKIKVRLQKSANIIYEYIENILDGKGGYIQNKYTKRAVTYGTRNVITAVPTLVTDVTDKLRQGPLDTIIGVFQMSKGIFPFIIYHMRNIFLSDVFDTESTKVRLINKKTLKREVYNLDEKERSKWITDDGLENIINKCKKDKFKNSPILINGNYLSLVYDNGKDIHIINDSEMLPDVDKELLRPITYGELLFLSFFKISNEFIGLITRYPITGLGSTIPSSLYLKSTVTGLRRTVKIFNEIEVTETSEYPKVNDVWFSSLSLPTMYLGPIDGDYDGVSI